MFRPRHAYRSPITHRYRGKAHGCPVFNNLDKINSEILGHHDECLECLATIKNHKELYKSLVENNRPSNNVLKSLQRQSSSTTDSRLKMCLQLLIKIDRSNQQDVDNDASTKSDSARTVVSDKEKNQRLPTNRIVTQSRSSTRQSAAARANVLTRTKIISLSSKDEEEAQDSEIICESPLQVNGHSNGVLDLAKAPKLPRTLKVATKASLKPVIDIPPHNLLKSKPNDRVLRSPCSKNGISEKTNSEVQDPSDIFKDSIINEDSKLDNATKQNGYISPLRDDSHKVSIGSNHKDASCDTQDDLEHCINDRFVNILPKISSLINGSCNKPNGIRIQDTTIEDLSDNDRSCAKALVATASPDCNVSEADHKSDSKASDGDGRTSSELSSEGKIFSPDLTSTESDSNDSWTSDSESSCTSSRVSSKESMSPTPLSPKPSPQSFINDLKRPRLKLSEKTIRRILKRPLMFDDLDNDPNSRLNNDSQPLDLVKQTNKRSNTMRTGMSVFQSPPIFVNNLNLKNTGATTNGSNVVSSRRPNISSKKQEDFGQELLKCAICGIQERAPMIIKTYNQNSCQICSEFFEQFMQWPRQFYCAQDGDCLMTFDSRCNACWIKICLQKFVTDECRKIAHKFSPKLQSSPNVSLITIDTSLSNGSPMSNDHPCSTSRTTPSTLSPGPQSLLMVASSSPAPGSVGTTKKKMKKKSNSSEHSLKQTNAGCKSICKKKKTKSKSNKNQQIQQKTNCISIQTDPVNGGSVAPY